MPIGFTYGNDAPNEQMAAAISTTVQMLKLHALLTNEPITQDLVERAIDVLFDQVRPQAIDAAKQQLGL